MVSILQRFLVLSNRQKSLIVLMAFFTMLLGYTTPGLSQPGDFGLIRPSNYSEDVDVWPVFEWESTPTPNCTYTLQISTDPQFSEGNYVEYDSLTTTITRPPVDLLMGQTLYYWRVKAVDSDGNYTWNNADQYPYNYWTLQTIPTTEPREIMGGGYLDYDRTLIPENSPYTMVQGNLMLDPNSLTIRAGVTVEIDGPYGIDVWSGELRMLATEEDSITVTKKNGNPGYWRDISFPAWCSSDSVVLQYINFSYAGSQSIYTINAPNKKLIIRNCVFKNCNNGAIRAGANSYITDNEIRNVKRGMYITGNNSRVENNRIDHCNEAGNGAGILCSGDSCVVKNNTVTFCQVSGQNSSRGGGVYLNGNYSKIINNDVSYCSGYIEVSGSGRNFCGGGVYVDGNYNKIQENEIDDCFCHVSNSNLSGGPSEGFGGGLSIAGHNNTITGNQLTGNYIWSRSSGSYSGSYGGGLYLSGNDNIIRNNQ